MAKWNLKLNIGKELKELQNFTQNMNNKTELDNFVAVAKKLEDKFFSYESEIKEVIGDNGTFEDLEHFVISFNVDNANYCMENIYQICDCADILLI